MDEDHPEVLARVAVLLRNHVNPNHAAVSVSGWPKKLTKDAFNVVLVKLVPNARKADRRNLNVSHDSVEKCSER